MGYTTDFVGRFKFDKPLAPEHLAYLLKFNRTRRMKRDEGMTATRPDPIREATGLPVGFEGEYFVGEGGFAGQCEDDIPYDQRKQVCGITDYNKAPADQPGLWCQWVPNEEGTALQHDDGEKFYDYVEWLNYIIENFVRPWGYTLNGEVHWQGEDSEDRGTIYVVGNHVTSGELAPVQQLAIAACDDWEHFDRSEIDRSYEEDY